MESAKSAAAERIGGADSGAVIAPELITLKTLARLIDASERHARRLSDLGWSPRSIRLGRCVRFNKAEIMSWIAAGCPRSRA